MYVQACFCESDISLNIFLKFKKGDYDRAVIQMLFIGLSESKANTAQW